VLQFGIDLAAGAVGFVDRLPAAFGAAGECRVASPLGRGDLALEFEVAGEACSIEFARGDGGLDCAARLALVAAIAEAALLGERGDVGEAGVDSARVLDQAELAHTGCVDENPAAGQHDKLTACGRVAAAAILTQRFGALDLATQKAVDERGLADARRADEGDSGAPAEVGAQGVSAVTRPGAYEHGRHAEGDRVDSLRQRVDPAEVDFVEDDDRRGAAVPNGGEVALEAAQIEVAVGRGDDEEEIDVGGDYLAAARFAGRPADKSRAPLEDVMDDGTFYTVSNGNPVAYHRAPERLELVAKPAAQLAERCAAAAQREAVASVCRDASGDQVRPVELTVLC